MWFIAIVSFVFVKLFIESSIFLASTFMLFVLSMKLTDGFASFISFNEISESFITKVSNFRFIFEVCTFILALASSKSKFGVFTVIESIEVLLSAIFKAFIEISISFDNKLKLDSLSFKVRLSFETSILFISKIPSLNVNLSRFIFVFLAEISIFIFLIVKTQLWIYKI